MREAVSDQRSVSPKMTVYWVLKSNRTIGGQVKFLTGYPCYFLFYQGADQGLGWKSVEWVDSWAAKSGTTGGLRFLTGCPCYFLFYQGVDQGLGWKSVEWVDSWAAKSGTTGGLRFLTGCPCYSLFYQGADQGLG